MAKPLPYNEPFYYCIKCEIEHTCSSKIGKNHIGYVPIFGGVVIPSFTDEEWRNYQEKHEVQG